MSSPFTHFSLDRRSPHYWRVTFDHPPINTMTATTVAELSELIDLIEAEPELNVVVFDSANPDFFLAHYDTEGNPAATLGLPPGPTGMHAWLDFTARLTRVPVVSVAQIRGRARGSGSEFVRACDLRFASRENALLGQFEVGTIADAELDAEVEAIAKRLEGFDHEAIAQTKWYVDQVTLPPDAELPPALHDFFDSLGRPGTIARSRRLAELGLNSDSDLERHLGKRVVESGEGVPA